MGKITFITGGARSGKSTFAEELLDVNDQVLYIATATPFDEEMKHRIENHKSRRNEKWETLEAYKNFDEILHNKLSNKKYILFDCITIMISNLMILDNKINWEEKIDVKEAAELEKNIQDEINKLLDTVRNFNGETIIVSNELGLGLVPPDPMSRCYRDIAGRVNQMIAGSADKVYFVVSGIPVEVK